MPASYIVVDTDVFIWLTRGKKQATRFAPLVTRKRIVLSFATVAELWRGAYVSGYGDASRMKLEADIGLAVVAQPTRALTQEWARLTNDARIAGHPLGQKAQAHDAWVAATALYFKLPLLTENRRHFENTKGLSLVDVPPPTPVSSG